MNVHCTSRPGLKGPENLTMTGYLTYECWVTVFVKASFTTQFLYFRELLSHYGFQIFIGRKRIW